MPDDAHIDPTADQIRELARAAQDQDGAVVMVNLLAFDGDDGRESYRRYAREVQPHLDRVGAVIVYAGDAAQVVIGGESRPWWDAIVVVRYPSRARFLDMVRDPGYRAIAAHRTAALATSGLVATDPWLG